MAGICNHSNKFSFHKKLGIFHHLSDCQTFQDRLWSMELGEHILNYLKCWLTQCFGETWAQGNREELRKWLLRVYCLDKQ
jgi:hypothetical protein